MKNKSSRILRKQTETVREKRWGEKASFLSEPKARLRIGRVRLANPSTFREIKDRSPRRHVPFKQMMNEHYSDQDATRVSQRGYASYFTRNANLKGGLSYPKTSPWDQRTHFGIGVRGTVTTRRTISR